MFLPLKLLELYATQTTSLVLIDFDQCYAEHLIKKKEINALFGLNEANNYRIFLPGPELKITPKIIARIKRVLYPLLRKAMNKKIRSADLNENSVKFVGDKNVYKISRIVASCVGNKDYAYLLNDIKCCINDMKLYSFQVTDHNIVTCCPSLFKSDPNIKYVVTTNFIDFLISSNNYGWRNCMRISGAYYGGPTALAMDEHTFIMGVVHSKMFTKRYGNRWITRQWGYYDKTNGLALNRVFGHSVIDPAHKVISMLINNVIHPKGEPDVTLSETSRTFREIISYGAAYLDGGYTWYPLDGIRKITEDLRIIEITTRKCLECGSEKRYGGTICQECYHKYSFPDSNVRNSIKDLLFKSFDNLIECMQLKKEEY